MSWEPTLLGDLVEITHGWAFKSEHFSTTRSDLPIVVNIGNFRYEGGFRFDETQVKRYTSEYPKDYELKPGDILLAMTCQTPGGEILGIPGRIPNDGQTYLHNQRLGKLVIKDTDRVSSDYLYWLFLWREFNHELCATATGTKILHTAPTRIENFEFLCPSIDEQVTIAEVLSSLDEKIELNRKQNRTLEAIAQALFKRWFVEFEFPDENGRPYKSSGGAMQPSELGEIPVGWEVDTLDRYFPVVTGKNDANFGTPDGQYPFFTCAQEHIMAPSYSFDASALLLAGNGDFNLKIYQGKFEAYQRTYVLIPYKEDLIGYLYYLIKNYLPRLTEGYKGSVINYLTKDMITQYEVPVPSQVVASLFGVFNELNARIAANLQENKTLANLRDTLLPKLMSGELRVPEARLAVEKAS